MLNQKFNRDEFEVIVVNDSGQPLPKMDWQQSTRVQVVNTNRRERSVARNTGAAIAQGRYLHFLDDDDWMLPDAFESFWELTCTTQAAWLYGGYRLVDNDGHLVKEYLPDESGNCFIQLIAGEWLPLQTSLIKADAFFEIGGFVPLQFLLGGAEDNHLSRQVVMCNDVVRIAKPVAVIRWGLGDSTTNYANSVEQLRQSREEVLGEPEAFKRLCASADACATNPAFWYGKLLWYYLASVRWNILHKQLFIAASRGVYSIVGFIRAGRYVLSADYWSGATKLYKPKYYRDISL